LPLAFISHFLADTIPHYGFSQKDVLGRKFNIYLQFDFVFSLLLMVVLAMMFPDRLFLIWACMILAAAPDIIWFFYRGSVKEWPKGLDRFTAWHFSLNAESHVTNIYYDIGWFVAMMTILIFLSIRL